MFLSTIQRDGGEGRLDSIAAASPLGGKRGEIVWFLKGLRISPQQEERRGASGSANFYFSSELFAHDGCVSKSVCERVLVRSARGEAVIASI